MVKTFISIVDQRFKGFEKEFGYPYCLPVRQAHDISMTSADDHIKLNLVVSISAYVTTLVA